VLRPHAERQLSTKKKQLETGDHGEVFDHPAAVLSILVGPGSHAA
jgi:hypothetical protein